MTTIIALAILLLSICVIRSTVIYEQGEEPRRSKLNVVFICICIFLSFLPFLRWFVLIGSPIITAAWYLSNGFDRYYTIEFEATDWISKIMLFKI